MSGFFHCSYILMPLVFLLASQCYVGRNDNPSFGRDFDLLTRGYLGSSFFFAEFSSGFGALGYPGT